MSTPISTLTPASLAQKLAAGTTLEELIQDCGTDAQLVTQLLHSKDFTNHLQLRIELALTQAKLQAAALLPACMANLQTLTTSEKPEVARRATVAIMAIAGLATTISPAKPSTPPAPEPPKDPEPPEEEDDDTDDGNDQDDTSDDEDDDPKEDREQRYTYRPFPLNPAAQAVLRHEAEILDFHRDLFFKRGIQLDRLVKLNFHGFADHIQAFFKPAGIIFGTNGRPYENIQQSIECDATVANAHAYFNQRRDSQVTAQPCPTGTSPEAKHNQNPNNSALSAGCDQAPVRPH